MQLFDTHFHFYGETTVEDYIANIKRELADPKQTAKGVVDKLFFNAVGADFKESLKAQEFAAKTENSVFSCGVHPHSAEQFLENREDFSIFKDDPRLAAVGELGLDYFYDYSDREAQKRVFSQFLELALEWNLPAVVHIRDQENNFSAYCDAYDILKDYASAGGRFVVHCFAGTPDWAEKFLELGAYCGVTGMVTFKKAQNIRDNLKAIPLERLLLETDSPYLAPIPHRGKENHSGYLVHVAAATAAEYDRTMQEIAEITTENAKKFLNLK